MYYVIPFMGIMQNGQIVRKLIGDFGVNRVTANSYRISFIKNFLK